MQLMHTLWRGCTLHVDMMDELERHQSQTWRIMSTCTTQFRGGPRHGKAQKLYEGDEDKNEGRLSIIDFEVYLDLELSCDIPFFSWVV